MDGLSEKAGWLGQDFTYKVIRMKNKHCNCKSWEWKYKMKCIFRRYSALHKYSVPYTFSHFVILQTGIEMDLI